MGLKSRTPIERVLLIVLAAVTMFCGSAPGSWADSHNLGNVLRLIGKDNAAHACPTSPIEALTNAHVARRHKQNGDVEWLNYIWSVGSVMGFLRPKSEDEYRDLAKVEPVGSRFPAWYQIAASEPKVGDKVYLLGYDWSKAKKAMADDEIEAKVTRIVAGHIQFVPSGVGGSSGSCLLNERGEVVGINEGSWPTDDGIGGMAVGVWRSILEVPK